MENVEYKELQERFDERYVKKEDCSKVQDSVNSKLSNDNARFAVLEYQQKINNWLTLAIAGGIVALVIKVYLGG